MFSFILSQMDVFLSFHHVRGLFWNDAAEVMMYTISFSCLNLVLWVYVKVSRCSYTDGESYVISEAFFLYIPKYRMENLSSINRDPQWKDKRGKKLYVGYFSVHFGNVLNQS